MKPAARAEYIVGCIREAGSMYPKDAAAFLAEHDAHRRSEVLTEAADVAARFTERWPDDDEMKADGIIGPFTAFGRIADELREMAGKDTDGAIDAPAGESTQPAPDFFQPGHTYIDTDPRNYWQFRCDAIVRHPEDGERTAIGFRHFKGEWETYEYGEGDWEIHQEVGHYTDITVATPSTSALPEPFVPRTERSYWVTIADALNATNAAGMHVGIDIDGTLTDRNAWSVIWNRDLQRWEVGGYDDDIDGLYADVPDADEWVRCSRPHCPNSERYGKAAERGWVNGHMDTWHCPDHAARPAEGEVSRG